MTQQIIQWITPTIEHFHMAGYWVAFLAALLETVLGVGLLLPGSTIILFLGAFSARGYLDLGDLIWFAVLGAVIGDNINYHLGKKFGARWTREGIWFLKKEHFEKATAFFERHGAKSVFWGRFIPSVKEMAPFIAGLAGMRQSTFMVWNILGGIGWGLQWVLAGYLFAQSLYLAKMWLTRMSFMAAIALALIFVIYFVRRAILKYGWDALMLTKSVAVSFKATIAANPWVAGFIKRHGKFFGFMSRRLTPKAFNGLPLTLLCLAFVYILILFAGIVEDFLTGDPIVAADIRIDNLLATFRTPHLVRFFSWVTLLGKWQVVLVFSVAATVVLWARNRRHEVAALLAILIGSQLFTQLSKLAFHRPRPGLPVYIETSFSFPSGHATVAAAFYGFLAYLLIHQNPKWKAKVNYFFTAALIVLLIGISRLYLGVHYLSDVWSGYLVGALWLVIGITLYKYLEIRFSQNTLSASLTKGRRVFTGLVIAAALVFYGVFAAYYHPEPFHASQAPGHITIPAPEDIFQQESLKYTESLIGEKELPINIVILAEGDARLLNMFKVSGWLPADNIGLHSLVKEIQAIILSSDYASAPLRPLFWNAHVNDFCFERSADIKSMKARRAIRLWRTSFVTGNGENVYVGHTSLAGDLIAELTHRISLDTDAQRDFFCRNMVDAGAVGRSHDIHLASPSSGRNLWGDPFVTDGNACVLNLAPRE